MTPHGIIVLSNHDGLAFPPHSRDPRPARSQPPFGVGQNLNPYPCDYYTAFASSGILYPLIHRYTLAGDLPLPVETMGLTTFRTSTILEGLGSACPPGTPHLRGVIRCHPYLATCLLAQASQPLWLVGYYDGSTAVHLS